MDAEKLAELKARVAAKGDGVASKPPPPRKAAAKKVPPAKKQSARPDGGEKGTARQSTIVPGTNHGAILCKCRTQGCVEYGEQKMVRIPMVGNILFLPGSVVCGECMGDMAWDRGDVHVDRIG